jgi:hypothetical protein
VESTGSIASSMRHVIIHTYTDRSIISLTVWPSCPDHRSGHVTRAHGQMAERGDHGRSQPGGGAGDAASCRLRPGRAREADCRHRQHLDRDRSLQLPPA